MRTIIAGSRGIVNIDTISDAIEAAGWIPTVVISGAARGADRLGEMWAEAASVPVERFPADWRTYGKRAGYIRNAAMAEVADALIAIWDGQSPGTANMIQSAQHRNLKIYIHRVPVHRFT